MTANDPALAIHRCKDVLRISGCRWIAVMQINAETVWKF